ncbi:MAG: hypothetical protein E7046_08205 [Lentisphaerae bacterium]|nr:hypothetical protein [Lentisphaerota bacterium]
MKTTNRKSALKGKITALFAAVMISFALHGSTSVFNDAVYWFRGGMDRNGNHVMENGEAFDELHANDGNHANHTRMAVKGWTENCQFVTEDVVLPAFGVDAPRPLQYLRINNDVTQEVVTESGTVTNAFPFTMNPHGIFNAYNISNKYSVVLRLRLESDPSRTEYFFRVAYSSTNPGLLISFQPDSTWVKSSSKYVQAFRWRRNADGTVSANTAEGASFNQIPASGESGLWAPTNKWFDMSIVVGEGKLRIGIAVPDKPNASNHQTINFRETDMITEGNILNPTTYMLFAEQYKGYNAVAAEENTYTKDCFRGSVQQIAIWDRMLSDEEVMEAFGMPRPAIFRVGLSNGSSSEFGGTRSGSAQTIDGLDLWRNVSNTMVPDDTWTVNFNAMRDESGLPQIFSMHALPGSSSADISVSLNGTSLGKRRVIPRARVFWPVPENVIVSGPNTLTIHRNGGTGDFLLDSMELGGSFGVGVINNANSELLAAGRLRFGTSTASPNPLHWHSTLLTYTVKTNNMSFWIDPDLYDRIALDFTTSVRCFNRGGNYVKTGNETFRLFVNGAEKWLFDQSALDVYTAKTISFAPGELNPGWNTMRFSTEDKDNCFWAFDYYRLKATLPRGFSIPPMGLRIICR